MGRCKQKKQGKINTVVLRDIMVTRPKVMAGGFQEVQEVRHSQWLLQQLGETFQQEAPKSSNKKGNQSERQWALRMLEN